VILIVIAVADKLVKTNVLVVKVLAKVDVIKPVVDIATRLVMDVKTHVKGDVKAPVEVVAAEIVLAATIINLMLSITNETNQRTITNLAVWNRKKHYVHCYKRLPACL